MERLFSKIITFGFIPAFSFFFPYLEIPKFSAWENLKSIQ